MCADSVQQNKRNQKVIIAREMTRHLVSKRDPRELARLMSIQLVQKVASPQSTTQKSSINCARKDIIVEQFNRAPDLKFD